MQRVGNEAVVQFSNSGPPLPPEIADRLFDSMISVRKEASGDNPHLGLGLYIASEIAKAHGGRIDVVSGSYETRFTFVMPID